MLDLSTRVGTRICTTVYNHTPLRRFSKLDCSTAKRVSMPNDTSSESSRRDVFNADLLLAPTLLQLWKYRALKIGPAGGGVDIHPRILFIPFTWYDLLNPRAQLPSNLPRLTCTTTPSIKRTRSVGTAAAGQSPPRPHEGRQRVLAAAHRGGRGGGGGEGGGDPGPGDLESGNPLGGVAFRACPTRSCWARVFRRALIWV